MQANLVAVASFNRCIPEYALLRVCFPVVWGRLRIGNMSASARKRNTSESGPELTCEKCSYPLMILRHM